MKPEQKQRKDLAIQEALHKSTKYGIDSCPVGKSDLDALYDRAYADGVEDSTGNRPEPEK